MKRNEVHWQKSPTNLISRLADDLGRRGGASHLRGEIANVASRKITAATQDPRTHRSAGFQTCCIADFQIGAQAVFVRPAGLKTRGTADLELCSEVSICDKHGHAKEVHGSFTARLEPRRRPF
ncbi:MAG: hypothetical protein HY298_15775 [Verrucomicrobia bacterium]|nr:hypothetical protein [Verrucomicrobiota bacterium]